jgi:hypothetical protein
MSYRAACSGTPPSVIVAFTAWSRGRETYVAETIEHASASFAIWCMEEIMGRLRAKV